MRYRNKISYWFFCVWFYFRELPQNLLGLLLKVALKKRIVNRTEYKGRKVFWLTFNIGVSLGQYIFLQGTEKDLRHEYGHCMQSVKWGWLYLPVIGIPSIVKNFLASVGIITWKSYYSHWPENEATKLGDYSAGGGG